MRLLKFGIENRESRSKLRRILAKAILGVEKKRADLYERYLNRKKLPCPDDPQEDAAMLEQIRKKISEKHPG